MFSWVEDGDLIYLKIDIFGQYAARAYFTTRIGGVSSGAYASLNMGLHVGDKKEDVLQNRKKIAASLGIDPGSFVAAEQVHGAETYVVTGRKRSGALDYHDSIPGLMPLSRQQPGCP